ncbi:hypothetical protein E4U17_007496 [Claviceps sp. LM77 group G4]|nr:hypothetical protein E4U17_007496 [Claviceps sp. LM77 group G4]
MSIQPNAVILPRARHRLPIDIDPETHSLMASLYPLQHLLIPHIPQHNIAVFASRRDEGLTVQDAETAPDGIFLVAMALVGLLDGAGDVVPEANAVVEIKR